MTDTEYLKWVAEHLVSFHFGLHYARVKWISNEGYEYDVDIEFEQNEEDIVIFKRLVDKAIKNEKNCS